MKLKKRRQELDRMRMYELDDPDGSIKRANDREELAILEEESKFKENTENNYIKSLQDENIKLKQKVNVLSEAVGLVIKYLESGNNDQRLNVISEIEKLKEKL